jgi:large conductance mechanosensitive channel
MKEKVDKATRDEEKAKRKELKKKMKAQRDSFWKDFKKFITKGNVIDMAVGVVIGSAFSAIVNGLVKMVINPCIALIPGADSLDNWKTILKEAVVDAEGVVKEAEVAILWGEWVQTIIQFIIIALSIFLAVRIIRSAGKKLRYKEIEAQRIADEKKKAEDKEKADAAAAAAAAEAARKEAQMQEFYANIARQTELLEELAKKK